MAFELSEEQRELAGTVDRLLADRTAGPRARQLLESPDGWRELWEQVAELGVLAMGAPEDAGGLGLGPVELVAVAEAVGRHLAPGPIVATAGAFVPTLARVAGEHPLPLDALRAVAERNAAAGLAWVDPRTSDVPRLSDGRLTAELVVPDATKIEQLAVVVADAVVLLDLADAELEPAVTIDETRPLSRVRVSELDVSERVFPLPSDGLNVAFTTAAAELVGLTDALLRMSVDYATERQQFGVPIGSFQAIKHRLADALIAMERARSLVYYAATAPTDATAAHFAKAAASEAATEVARAAVQVHGGIGITREHDVSLLYLRARQASMQLGDADAHYLAAVTAELASAAEPTARGDEHAR